ncbi:hypothetical protein [Cellulomonas hominis]
MATFSAVTRQHILQAISEYDDRGGEAFLGVYGFQPSTGTTLHHEGKSYDSRAILGVAHKYATGRLATSEDFHGGAQGTVPILRKHGFEVTGPAAAAVTATAAPAPRQRVRPTPTTRRAAVPERVAPVCPTCSMTLPATGVCDDCG